MIRRIGIPAAGKRKSFALLGKLFLLTAVLRGDREADPLPQRIGCALVCGNVGYRAAR